MTMLPLYDITQCALYKVGSKKRLANVLCSSVTQLRKLARRDNNYRRFLLPASKCLFTGKIVNERWVQEPKSELRQVHERLKKLLSRVIAPEYAHAAVKQRSYRSNAEAHVGSNRVATFDIRKFFPSTSSSLIRNFFLNQLRCPGDVAGLLTELCCFRDENGLGGLPTGSPLSPMLSLYANKPIFDRFHQYAKLNGLIFTCYMDDLTFSGAKIPRGLVGFIRRSVRQFGHELADKKNRIFSANEAKHVTGIVIFNNKLQVPYSRHKKARAIANAVANQSDLTKKMLLQQKLAGLLGEAAFIDQRYREWAERSYKELRLIRAATVM